MEHEITGHTKKVYKAWKNKDTSAWTKVKEIGIEVLIIVFAVSFAAFLEREREHAHEQKEVKEFLLGLKNDLLNDIKEMEEDKLAYKGSGRAFKYLSGLKPGEKIQKDSLQKFQSLGYLLNTTSLVANDGRYEGFKSSGKITTIENHDLQNDILDVYQEDIPSLLSSSGSYTQRKSQLFRYLFDNMKRNPDGTNNMAELLATEQAYNLAVTLNAREVLQRYDVVINKSKRIIATIDKEYPSGDK